jgi:hypothetical protein
VNWEAAGAIGEIVGAAGVIVTLVYLAAQIRQNTKSLRASAVWDSQMSFVAINESLADGGRISEIMFRAISDAGSLDAFESHLAHRFARSFFQRMEAQHALYSNGILDREVWELRCGYAQSILGNPVFEEAWQLDKQNGMFTSAFIDAIESTPRKNLPGFMGVDQTPTPVQTS